MRCTSLNTYLMIVLKRRIKGPEIMFNLVWANTSCISGYNVYKNCIYVCKQVSNKLTKKYNTCEVVRHDRR